MAEIQSDIEQEQHHQLVPEQQASPYPETEDYSVEDLNKARNELMLHLILNVVTEEDWRIAKEKINTLAHLTPEELYAAVTESELPATGSKFPAFAEE